METRIGINNIGDGSCAPATIEIGATTTCSWKLVGGPAGTVYYINNPPNQTTPPGSINLIGALVHSEASSASLTSLGGVKAPVEISNFQTDVAMSSKCSVLNNKLVCDNIIANGNLALGEKYVDIVFQGSTPPIVGQNDFYGNPSITLNKAKITLTAAAGSSSSGGGSTTSGSTSSSSTSGSTSTSSTSGSTTSTSTSGTPFLPLPSSSTSGTVPSNK